MYKVAKDSYIYSPSDLAIFLRSPFSSWVARLKLDKPDEVKDINKDYDPILVLLGKQGFSHESDYLKKLKEQYGENNVKEISNNKETAAAETIKAMQDGVDVIFQAYLQRDNFVGYADFLIKKPGKSNLGDYYYEAWDTKRSKSVKPYFLIQLCCYSWMLEEIQGKLPEEMVIVLGNQKEEHIRIAAYYSYFLNFKQQFLSIQENFKRNTVPDLVLYSDYGEWGTYAKQLLTESDSLMLVANIRKTQIVKLGVASIDTLTQLAQTEITEVTGLKPEIFNRLRAQANLQLTSRNKKIPDFEVLKDDAGKGLSALPQQSEFDIFFDIEGHPLAEGGLEYLWGASYYDTQAVQGTKYAFKDWWGHDQAQEKLAFEGFIDWVYQRWQHDSKMHIYHYASYEITAIRKLSTRYQTRQDEFAKLLENNVFIDLYKIVKNGLLVGEPKYSIKNIEHLYGFTRETDVANGGESVVVYENWRDQGGAENWAEQNNGYKSWLINPDQFDWSAWKELEDIRVYNIDDCESTLELVGWLRTQQKANSISYTAPISKIVSAEPETRQQASRRELVERQKKLIAQFEGDEQLKKDFQAQLLVALLHFHNRERKSKIWAYYDRLEKTDDELLDDDTVVQNITGITFIHKESKYRCTAIYDLDQSIRTDKIKSANVQGAAEVKVSNIKFTELNEYQGEISFDINAASLDVLKQSPFTLFGDEEYINTETLENRLCTITEAYFDDGTLSGALSTVINQTNPDFAGGAKLLPVTRHLYPDNNAYLDAVTKAVQAMDETCLCIQGPPGSGKTYTAKYVIKELVKQGNRIGIMSNSHAAIMNLLESLVLDKALSGIAIAKVGGYGNNQIQFQENFPPATHPNFIYRTSMSFAQKQPYTKFQIVGGTAFSFATDLASTNPLDYLFVDEAGQVALANLVAVSGAAKNIILIGDQKQLEQPTQGSHPGDSGASALEFMLKEHAVIPEDKGIFLERTYRMHSAICQPLSEVMYEGKLQADTNNDNQAITIPQPKLITQKNGILSIPVVHKGRTQSSTEEVDVVQKLINELKTGSFTNKDGQTRQITEQDILVVAPYNMQVNLLKKKLNSNLKIGTIDKFQGQEAPVVIISMAVSDVADSPRGLDFVFDMNRLNVAISRAQALAIVVANQGLELCSVNSLEQMERVGFFCRIKAG